MEIAQYGGVHLQLRRESGAEDWQSRGWIDAFNVRSFIVDDPKSIVARLQWFEAGAEEPIDAHQAQIAADNSSPAGFAEGFSMR